MTRLELVRLKHALEKEIRELERRERVFVEALEEALAVIEKFEPARGLPGNVGGQS